MLEYTSLLFASVPLHAFYRGPGAVLYHHIFLLVTALSILYHSTKRAHIRVLDTAVAHLAYLFMLWETVKASQADQSWLAVFPSIVLALWIAEFQFTDHKETIHAVLHATSTLGLHLFLLVL